MFLKMKLKIQKKNNIYTYSIEKFNNIRLLKIENQNY